MKNTNPCNHNQIKKTMQPFSCMSCHHKTKKKYGDTVIRAGIACSFYIVPNSLPTIEKLDMKVIALHNHILPPKMYVKCHHISITRYVWHRSILVKKTKHVH